MSKLTLIVNRNNKKLCIRDVIYFDHQRDNILVKTEFCSYAINLSEVDNVMILASDNMCDICKYTDKTSNEEPCSSCTYNSTDNWVVAQV